MGKLLKLKTSVDLTYIHLLSDDRDYLEIERLNRLSSPPSVWEVTTCLLGKEED